MRPACLAGACENMLSPQHAKLRPLAGRPAPMASFESVPVPVPVPAGKHTSTQAARAGGKLSMRMQSSPGRSNQATPKTSIASERDSVNEEASAVTSKAVMVTDLPITYPGCKPIVQEDIGEMSSCSSKVQGQTAAAAPAQLCLETRPQDQTPAAVAIGASKRALTITVTGSVAQATCTFIWMKTSSTPSNTSPGLLASTSAAPTCSDAPDQTPQETFVIPVHTTAAVLKSLLQEAECATECIAEKTPSTSQALPASAAPATAAAVLNTPLEEAGCATKGIAQMAPSTSPAMPASPIAAAAAAATAATDTAAAQHVTDSLQDPSPASSADDFSAPMETDCSQELPEGALLLEAEATPIPAPVPKGHQPTSPSCPWYIYPGLTPKPAMLHLNMLTSKEGISRASLMHKQLQLAHKPQAALPSIKQPAVTRHMFPASHVSRHMSPANAGSRHIHPASQRLLHTFLPQAAASITRLLDQALTAPTPDPGGTGASSWEAGFAERVAGHLASSESAAACDVVWSVPTPAAATALREPTAAAAASSAASSAAATAVASAKGLASIVPRITAMTPAGKTAAAAKLAEQAAKQPPVWMPFNLMGPSLLPELAHNARASAATLSPQGSAVPHVSCYLACTPLLQTCVHM